MYMKPITMLFLFELEHCVEHAYFWLCQNTHMVIKKFKHLKICNLFTSKLYNQ